MIKVSVCTMTYNQEKYIAQTIESVLMQKTNFKIEMVIAEDYSTDSTRAIVADFVKKYPEIIKPVYQEKNIGAAKNSISCLNACSGEYIAMLEGDDYWIDPLKLQKQVDFLDHHLDYSICFNRVYEQIDDDRVISPNNPWEEEKTFTIYDLATLNFMHTNSVVYRNDFVKILPHWFDESPIGDFVMHLFNAKNGKIKYFPDIMGVYRVSSGIWSTRTMLFRIEQVLKVLELLESEGFDANVMRGFQKHKHRLLNEYFKIKLQLNDFSHTDIMENYLKTSIISIDGDILLQYSNQIHQLLNSKTYKLIKILSNVKYKIFK